MQKITHRIESRIRARSSRSRNRIGASTEESLDELLGDELAQVLRAFAEPHVSHGDLQLVADAENHPTLRRSVQLGKYDSCQGDGLFEHFRLRDGVLPVGRVKNQ